MTRSSLALPPFGRRSFAMALASMAACKRTALTGDASETRSVLPVSVSASALALTEVPPAVSSRTEPTGDVTLLDWSFPDAARQGGAERVVVVLPEPLKSPTSPTAIEQTRFPVLIALHGRGEAVRGAEAGAYGWVRDYHLPQQLRALAKGQLDKEDFSQIVAPDRLWAFNASLAARPFGGLILVCPHTPNILTPGRDLEAAAPFGRWLVETLLPRVYAECPAQGNGTGIDGVSLGGRVALLVGTAHPSAFRSVGTLQPAFQEREAAAMAVRAQAYMAARPEGKLRLLTSEGDFFRTAVAKFHQAFAAAKVPHEHVVIPGPHDYVFNRGPGGLEMLFWHDRVLRGHAAL